MSLLLDRHPRLSLGARLRFDRQSESYVLLSPERGLRLNGSAAEVLQRCTGELTVREIVKALQQLTVPECGAELTTDVLNLLLALEQRHLIVFAPSS